MRVVIATNNQNKVREIKQIVNQDSIEFFSLADLNLDSDPEETGSTFLENATIKAESALEALKKAGLKDYVIVADDSGLCVDALDGAPGVYSARFAQVEGQECSYSDNNKKLLEVLKDIDDQKRNAHFETVALMIMPDGKRSHFCGRFDGKIAKAESGTNGFGYDPIFIPEIDCNGHPNSSNMTLAEFSPSQKTEVSHRSKAFRGLFSDCQ